MHLCAIMCNYVCVYVYIYKYAIVILRIFICCLLPLKHTWYEAGSYAAIGAGAWATAALHLGHLGAWAGGNLEVVEKQLEITRQMLENVETCWKIMENVGNVGTCWENRLKWKSHGC